MYQKRSKSAPIEIVPRESEYDILEKRLLSLEYEVELAKNKDEFKELFKIKALCENRWIYLYCREHPKPLENNKNEAIGVMNYNLEIRRKGLHNASYKLFNS